MGSEKRGRRSRPEVEADARADDETGLQTQIRLSRIQIELLLDIRDAMPAGRLVEEILSEPPPGPATPAPLLFPVRHEDLEKAMHGARAAADQTGETWYVGREESRYLVTRIPPSRHDLAYTADPPEKSGG